MNSKLSLRWRDHHSALITMLENHLDNSTLSDCVIAAEGQYIKAHKVVLSSCSPYFQLLFTLENEKNPIVVLKDVKFDDLKAVIDFVYRGEVQVFEDQLVTFLETAESLQIKGLGRNNNERFGKRKKGDSPGKRSREHSSTPPPEDCAAKRQAYEAEEEALELVPVMDETQRDCWKGAKREPFCSDLPSTSSKEAPPYNFRSAKVEAPSSQGSTQGSTMHLDIAPALPEPSLSAEDCLAETDSVVKTESLSDSEMGQTEEYMEDALSEGGGEGFMRNEMEDMVGGPSGGHGGSSGCTGRTMEQPMMRTHYPGGPPSQPESSSLATDNAMMASQMANSQDFMLGLGTLESTSNGSVPGGHMASEPSTSLGPCEAWVRAQAAELGLPVRADYPANPRKPVLILTWAGTQPELPSIMLNSHMDVVPVYEERWTHKPFAAERTDDGKIYARGAQDMKSVGVQYLEAVRRLKLQGFKPRRTLHIVFVPDEEISGHDGMESFVKSKTFADMKVGFGLDEGMPYPGEEFVMFYGERSNWKLDFVCRGNPGHGSLLMDNPAAERVRVILNNLLDFRTKEKSRVTNPLAQGQVTSVNVTMLQGGVQNNVVPPEMTISADVRLATTANHDAFLKMVQGWCTEAGDTELRVQERGEVEGVTELSDSNKWWIAFKGVFERMNLKVMPIICPGGTDARFLRRLGIPAFGISLQNNTPILLHDHDEFIHEDVFLKGICIYKELLRALTAIQ